jgi:NAD+ kinase
MKYKFSHIALSTSSQDKRVLPIATQVYEILSNAGIKVSFDLNLEKLEKDTKIKHKSSNYITKNAELLIAIGGDGTMLNCSRRYGSKGVSILGINLGKVGFLSDIAPNEMTSRLLEVIKGDYVEDKRFFLEASLEGKKGIHTALNEIVIHSGAIAQLIEFDLYIDDSFVYRQKADGLIINSPTGSTAYSLSGGGPIVHPGLEAITLLPMFPQSLSTSPLVVKASSKIKVDLINNKLKSQLSFDSHESLMVKGHQEIVISRSKSELNLIHPKDHDFFEGCRNKLGWSSGLVKQQN